MTIQGEQVEGNEKKTENRALRNTPNKAPSKDDGCSKRLNISTQLYLSFQAPLMQQYGFFLES